MVPDPVLATANQVLHRHSKSPRATEAGEFAFPKSLLAAKEPAVHITAATGIANIRCGVEDPLATTKSGLPSPSKSPYRTWTVGWETVQNLLGQQRNCCLNFPLAYGIGAIPKRWMRPKLATAKSGLPSHPNRYGYLNLERKPVANLLWPQKNLYHNYRSVLYCVIRNAGWGLIRGSKKTARSGFAIPSDRL